MNCAIIENVALLVVSCDNYADVWQPFFSLFTRYWPDCPFRIYLLSNFLDPGTEAVGSLKVGKDVSWSDNLRKALGILEEDYVFMVVEDLFLTKRVNTFDVLALIDWAISKGANYLRLNPYPAPDTKVNEMVGAVSHGAIYRTSTVMSLWKKEILYDLLKPNENAWQFEIEGSKRSDRYHGFYSARTFHFHVINGVIKSKWCREAISHLKGHGIEPDLSVREAMTPGEEFAYNMRQQRSRLFRLFPNTYRRRIRESLVGD